MQKRLIEKANYINFNDIGDIYVGFQAGSCI